MNRSSWFGADGDSGLKVLWEDGELVFCRGESHADGRRAAVLAVLPAAEHPTPATLDRLAREYGLKDELRRGVGGATARARPRTRSDHAGARGYPRRAAGPIARGAHGGAELSAPRHRGRCGPHTDPPAGPRPQGHQARQYPGEPRDRRGQAHRFRYRFASGARAAGARAARVDRGHARLYGARTDRTNEPLDRRPQRPLRPRRHALPDDHGLTAFCRG